MKSTEQYVLPRTGTAEFRASVEDWDGTRLAAADITSIACNAYSVHPTTGELTALATELAITPGDVIHADTAWDQDSVGFNFSHVYPNRTAVFTDLKKKYRVEYRLTPANADLEVIVVVFEFTLT